ncbi:hypothetical protein JOC33_002568 [Thalassobacillus pellis]|nr:hypothetical protein [Thalassobacillus pellis]
MKEKERVMFFISKFRSIFKVLNLGTMTYTQLVRFLKKNKNI